MKFKEIVVNRTLRFSLGYEEENSIYYLAIPMSNSVVDYEEYYKISKDDFDDYSRGGLDAALFVDECRKRQHDNLLFFPPGTDRGSPS